MTYPLKVPKNTKTESWNRLISGRRRSITSHQCSRLLTTSLPHCIATSKGRRAVPQWLEPAVEGLIAPSHVVGAKRLHDFQGNLITMNTLTLAGSPSAGTGKLSLPSFGTFTMRKMKAGKALNPRTGEPIKVKARKTVRFKVSPKLNQAV